MTKEKKEYLFTDNEQYNYNVELEKKCFSLFETLNNQAKDVLGSEFKIDYLQLVKDAKGYISSEYFKNFTDKPAHLEKNKERICQSETGCDFSDVQRTSIAFNRSITTANKYAPKLSKSGLKSIFTKSTFNRYLDPEKKAHYEAVQRFFDASQNLKKYGERVEVHLIRYTEGELWFDGYVAKINHLNFAL